MRPGHPHSAEAVLELCVLLLLFSSYVLCVYKCDLSILYSRVVVLMFTFYRKMLCTLY